MKRILLSLLLLAGCGPAPPKHIIVTGSVAGGPGVEISGGHAFIPEGRPGVFFGLVHTAGSSPRFSYVVVLKGIPAEVQRSDGQGRSVADGDGADSDHTLTLGAWSVRAEYAVSKKGESIRINGLPLNPAQGRVFLLDVRAEGAGLDQRNTPLPEGHVSPLDVHSVGIELLEALRAALPEFMK